MFSPKTRFSRTINGRNCGESNRLCLLQERTPLAGDRMSRRQRIVTFLICSLVLSTSASADDLIKVEFKQADKLKTVNGRLVVEAADGGVLVETRASQLVSVTPGKLVKRTPLATPFTPMDAGELSTTLLSEFGPDFKITTTKRYVICSNANKHYVNWTGTLLQRLMAGYYRYWKTADLNLQQPEFPLIAIIFASQSDYVKYATADVGPAVAQAQGYYSAKSNRVITYDLTATVNPATTNRELQKRLQRNQANIATVVHEATHQLAFNSGLHTRYADNPNWLTEGMAMFFETPDIRNSSGWRTIGRVNPVRLKRFRSFAAGDRPADSLNRMLSTNKSFEGEIADVTNMYSQAWAFNYFLIRKHRKEYIAYLKTLQQKKCLIWDSAADRLKDFETAFGKTPEAMEIEFMKYIRRMR